MAHQTSKANEHLVGCSESLALVWRSASAKSPYHSPSQKLSSGWITGYTYRTRKWRYVRIGDHPPGELSTSAKACTQQLTIPAAEARRTLLTPRS